MKLKNIENKSNNNNNIDENKALIDEILTLKNQYFFLIFNNLKNWLFKI